ncbi:hypothetical protein [Kineosporia babensis]|uniref:Uncharacterized protein n=1 Tax=Kineosporia babensis TaxID=499548 RepID=A0A9X1STS1_9ACTN|nr:hypothetical protein [Kineosporia babensis]MCD5310855.1 hypothetical protein [Kineosporia babensis]
MTITWTESRTTPYDTDQETQAVTLGALSVFGLRRENGIPTARAVNGYTSSDHTSNELRAYAAQLGQLADELDKAALR